MPEDVKVPGLGTTPKKWVYAGGALLVGIVGYAYYKRSRTSAIEPINPDALPTDRVPFTDAQVSSGLTESASAGLPLTVADWGQQATNRLIELNKDPEAVASALGKYVTHQALTVAEADIVRSAIGQFGQPPGGGTYAITLLPASSSTTPTPTPTPTPKAARHKYVVQLHIPTSAVRIRDYVRRFSDPAVSNPTTIQVATVRTTADPRNARSLRVPPGEIIGRHRVYLTTVQKA